MNCENVVRIVVCPIHKLWTIQLLATSQIGWACETPKLAQAISPESTFLETFFLGGEDISQTPQTQLLMKLEAKYRKISQKRSPTNLVSLAYMRSFLCIPEAGPE